MKFKHHTDATMKEALDAIHHPESGIAVPDYRLNDKDLAWMRSRLDVYMELTPKYCSMCTSSRGKRQRSVVLYQEQQAALSQAFMISLDDIMTNRRDYRICIWPWRSSFKECHIWHKRPKSQGVDSMLVVCD
jgi:hypothetical protein